MKEDKDYACGLELKPGLNGVNYKAQYYHAPKACYPEKNPHQGEAVNPGEVMSHVLKAK